MGSPLHVLFVAPTGVPAAHIAQILSDGGYEPSWTEVSTAAEFDEALPSRHWDVIIAGYAPALPFSGATALTTLRNTKRDIPFLIVCNDATPDTVADAMRQGAHDFIVAQNLARLVPAVQRECREAAERQQRREDETHLRVYNQRLVMLHAIDQAILSDVAPESVCAYALRFLCVQMNVWGGEIVLFDTTTNEARVLATYRRTPESAEETTADVYSMEAFTPQHFDKLSKGSPYYIPRLADGVPVAFSAPLNGLSASYLSVPITGIDGLLGTMILLSDDDTGFSGEQRSTAAEVAHHLATAIRQGRVLEQIQRSSAELERRVYDRTKELQYATHRAAAILNNTSDAIIVTNNKGLIQETNPAFREMFGYYSDTMTGFNISQMFDLEEQALLEEALKAAVTFGKADNIEMTAIRADGTHFDADIAVVSILENGVLENIVYSVRDVTRRKLVELELRDALDQQRELVELKSRFVSMASHEFRTPLAIIRAATDMLGAYRHRMEEATIDMRLDKIRAQITHLTALMDDVLTLARDQAGKSAFNAEWGDLDAFCQEIIDQFVTDPDMGHVITYTCDPQPLMASFDPTLMRKAVYNLLSNALKYSPRGSEVTVAVTQHDSLATIRVRDEGVGIPEADQKRLFEAFHRGSNVSTISGTGLGLTIAKQSIEAHGGSLRFESRVDHGTTFIATIPSDHPAEGAL